VQLRLKDVDDAAITAATHALMPIAHDHGVAFVINDRADLAAALDADGVHIGQSDAPYDAARARVGPEAIVGVTCHNSRHLAMQAGEQGADYVAFGAFYETATKQAATRAAPDLLSWWQRLFEIPCVAIGGITPDNAAPLVAAGADFLAVSSGVWSYPPARGGPAGAVARLNAVMAATPLQVAGNDG